jgi:ribA/ribD-fused uncharacterized protein
LQQELNALKTRIVQQEAQSRRNNLLFYGVPEQINESWQDCEKKIRSIMSNSMGMQNVDSITFERVHRLGMKNPHKSRPIIAKFCHFKAREAVWKLSHKLISTNYKLSEDFPIEILNERKTLYPIFKAAKTSNAVKSALLKVDKLHIDNRIYTTKNLNELPNELRPENLATKVTDKVVLFASKHSTLSNFYSEYPIRIDGQLYCSTEQYYQSEKARFLGDDHSASKVMAESDPYKIHELGKRILNRNHGNWEPHARMTLLKANRAKFAQFDLAKQALMSTKNLPIGEATKDPTFGIGLHIRDPAALDYSNWTGKK